MNNEIIPQTPKDHLQVPLILISGPTATGKTSLSIHLAISLKEKGIAAEIINFDSLLFYHEISIGTAKPSALERCGIPHHLISIDSIKNDLNASDFITLAKNKISELHSSKIIPILVGGSAFYLRALMKGMYEEDQSLDSKKDEVKAKWKIILQNRGIAPIVEYLQKNDPKALELFHSNDHYRLTRAAEHFDLTGEMISLKKKSFDELDPYDFSTSPYRFIHFYLNLDKNTHFPIIQARVETMLKNGLIQEVDELLKMGFSQDLKPLQSIGYKETISFLNGEISSIEKLKELISIHTRQLAKSQRTFFNKITPKITLNPLLEREKIVELSLKFING